MTFMWPTTIGAICIVVGGLSLFGGCLAMTGMSEMQQLHTAVPFGEGEMGEQMLADLALHAPPAWVELLISLLHIIFSIILVGAGMALLQRSPSGRIVLLTWSYLYIVFTLVSVVVNWSPRWDLVQSNAEVQGMFLAQMVISLPLYLALPVFMLFFLNRTFVRVEVAQWR